MKKRKPSRGEELRALACVSVAGARGRPSALRRELRAALRLPVSRVRLHETLLQLVPFAGFARAINVFGALHDLAPSSRYRTYRGDRRRSGAALCRRIYGPAYGRLMSRMRAYHPDLADWIIEDGYGKVLSRPGLSVRERELLILPVLAALGLPLQLDSHYRGALRVGVTRREIKAVFKACRLKVPGFKR